MYKSRHIDSHLTKISVCFLAITMFGLASRSTSVAAESSYVHGIYGVVVDEEGVELSDVRVQVYTSGGAFVVNTSTGSDGFFNNITAEYGTYTIYFTKPGYAKTVKSITIQKLDTDLGTIVLQKAVRLYSSALGLVASPGGRLLIPFVVSNIGAESEVLGFLISNPGGWPTRVLSQAGDEVLRVALSSGASLNLQLEVTIPLASAEDNNLTLTAVGRTNSTLDFTIKVKQLDTSLISCQFPGKSATPGDTASFQVRLRNSFGVKMRFRILVDHVPPNWTASVKSLSGEDVTDVILGSNEYVDLVVEATPPDTAKIGEEYRLLFKVESYDGNLLESLPFDITLTKGEEAVKIAVKFPEVTIEAGKILQYPVTITNTGVDRLLLLSIEPPAGWKVVFKYGTLEILRLYVESKKSENLVIEATPPSTVNIGAYTIPVQVKSEEGSIYAEINLKATITGSYALRLEPSTLLTSVTAGSSTTFTTKITNTGYTRVTSLSLSAAVPTGWDVSITPVRVESLEPSASYTFTVMVKTPTDTVAGDYLITLGGSSDQVRSDQVQVRITATVPTSWGLIGVGIAAAVVIALIFAFMKFRRR